MEWIARIISFSIFGAAWSYFGNAAVYSLLAVTVVVYFLFRHHLEPDNHPEQ